MPTTPTRYLNSPEIKKIDQLFISSKVWNSKQINKFCKTCHTIANNNKYGILGPSIPWYIGKDFNNLTIRILFVGKVLEGKGGYEVESLKNSYKGIYNLESFDNKQGSTFIKYIFNIMNKLAEDDYLGKAAKNLQSKEGIKEFLAITNLVKCGAVKDTNKKVNPLFVEKYFADNCVNKLCLLDKEIEIIKPNVVIFLTSNFAESVLEAKYFKNKTEHPLSKWSKEKGCWISYDSKNKRLYIASWHPERKPKIYFEESYKIYKKYINKHLHIAKMS